jgi:hypothetical protein
LGELSFTIEVKNEFDPTRDTQLRKNLKQVPFDRDSPTLEFSCNLTVREAVSHQANNLLLPLGKQNYSRGGGYTQSGRLDSLHVAPAVSLVLAVDFWAISVQKSTNICELYFAYFQCNAAYQQVCATKLVHRSAKSSQQDPFV